MNDFSEIKPQAQIIGLLPNERPVWVEAVIPQGEESLKILGTDSDGNDIRRIIHKEALSSLSIADKGLAWSFDSDPNNFKLALEAKRITLGSLFDPMMAIHSSNIEPLPHQISAVYESMLPRQPLRFVLADDPGAGKTIMAGLLIKELIMRGDAKRVLIVAPGSLTEQWQDELLEKFSLDFKIFSKEQQELSSVGNYFAEADYLIARVDQLARNENYRNKLHSTSWDLIIVDEAHKMAAHMGSRQKVDKTQRYQLGEMLSTITRHFLLMTATPHNGSDSDFHLWLSMIDPDRFYGVMPSPSGYTVDVSDVMRRMVKEKLLRFDGTRLFPERRAITACYELSQEEQDLYDAVTKYVVDGMNLAKRKAGEKGNQVGFALTVLQRRLASSPAAIYKSLTRRLENLEKQLKRLKEYIAKRATGDVSAAEDDTIPVMPDIIDDDDEDDWTPEEYERYMDSLLCATASNSVEELEQEVEMLKKLAKQALAVYNSGNDRKWAHLSEMLREDARMKGPDGRRHKLIIFTEHKDTLDYLQSRIVGLLGDENHVRTISGSDSREIRRQKQEEFRNNPDVDVLIATDAAGEGVNLQVAHLLINYDLPWNPNRLEQRFGRIHRIGQTETCLMWNMVATGTREGDVFQTLFTKLEAERASLGGQVFDILGEAFKEKSLKELLLEAIRQEQSGDAERWMKEKVEEVLNHNALKQIMQRNMLVEQAMSKEALFAVKAELDKAEARKLQPYFIEQFFLNAFRSEGIGGFVVKREEGRYEVRHVPAELMEHYRQHNTSRLQLTQKYERICFDKEHIRIGNDAPQAEFIHPGHPLMQTLTESILDSHQNLLKAGTVLISETDDMTSPYLVVMLSHTVAEGSGTIPVSQRLQFVRINPDGTKENGGWAPHLDLAAPKPEYKQIVNEFLSQEWLRSQDWEKVALDFAADVIAKEHFDEVSRRRIAQVDKIASATQERLVVAINKYNADALHYEQQIREGKGQSNAQPNNARQKAKEIAARLKHRLAALDEQRNMASLPPIVMGCMLVIPQGYINQKTGEGAFCVDPLARKTIEMIAMNAVMDKERSFGHTVTDISKENLGWDITAQPQSVGDILPNARHIEVKGKAVGSKTVTITSNEVKTALNQGDKFILAIVMIDENGKPSNPRYIRNPFNKTPDQGALSVNYDLSDLISRSVTPEETL